MTRKSKNPWDRTEPSPRPATQRTQRIRQLQQKKILSVKEAAEYLNISLRTLNILIKAGVVETVCDTRIRYVATQTLRGLVLPVRSLNKRLQYLDDLRRDIERKINHQQARYDKLIDTEHRTPE